MRVVLVHGWGVRQADYGNLPATLRQALGAEAVEVHLSEYISYSDAVTMHDLAEAFERARHERFADRPFACITHSTGGPVVRLWLARYGGPITHLIMLAPPNHGSALAQLGKSRVSRIKSWMEGVEPGQRILDWLECGSAGSWELNLAWLRHPAPIPMAVIVGETPDRSLYDHLNNYTAERGSDGIVRVASANLNFRWMKLKQRGSRLGTVDLLQSPAVPLMIAEASSHRGVLDVNRTLASSPRTETAMVIFRVRDTNGAPVRDFDLLLTAGPAYDPDALPHGFFIDRQRNAVNREVLTYYFDYGVFSSTQHVGFMIHARPDTGPVYYQPAEYQGGQFLKANETLLVDVELERIASPALFTLTGCRA